MEQTAPSPVTVTIIEKVKPKPKEKPVSKIRIEEKKVDSDPGRVVKKDMAPESTKSQNKPEIKPETIESAAPQDPET